MLWDINCFLCVYVKVCFSVCVRDVMSVGFGDPPLPWPEDLYFCVFVFVFVFVFVCI